MGQPTLPSPATSNDDFISAAQRPGTPWCKPTRYAIPADPEKTLGPYWKMHPRSVSPGYEMGTPSLSPNLAYLTPGQTLGVPLYPSTADSMGEAFTKSPVGSKLAPYTPETSPPARSRVLRHRRAATARSQESTPQSAPNLRSFPVRERRAARTRGREQKQRDVSGVSGKPLSDIARENPQVLVPDAEAFAHRPVEDRRVEAANAGKIKRPLNAFMLYRRSYQNVAKIKCLRNNHQQISSICGDSWKASEPQGIIDKFTLLAVVEKEMHELAFPDYKYDPVLKKAGLNDLADSSELDRGYRPKPSKQAAQKTPAKTSALVQRPQPILDGLPTDVDITAPAIHSFKADNLPYYNQPAAEPDFGNPCEASQVFYVDSNMYHGGPLQTQTVNAHALALPSTYISTGVIDPRLFYVDASCIDTALLVNSIGSVNEPGPSNLVLGPKSQDESFHQGVLKKDVFLPDMDEAGTYNAYLKGTDADWEVMPLDEGTQFSDWIAQTEQCSSWA